MKNNDKVEDRTHYVIYKYHISDDGWEVCYDKFKSFKLAAAWIAGIKGSENIRDLIGPLTIASE